jgi:hypothetical protein
MNRISHQTTSSADRWANMAVVAIVSMLAYFVVITKLGLSLTAL